MAYASSAPAADFVLMRGSIWLRAGAVAVVVLALAFGGGTLQGLWSDAFVQLCSLPLLGLAICRLWREPLPFEAKWPIWLIGSTILLLILQLVPLPPPMWSTLPGRAPFVRAFQAAGIALPWEPLSLDPGATTFSLFSLMPAIAAFLAILCLDLKARRILSLIIIGFAFVSVFLGLAQLAGGPESPLRFYDPTNADSSVGFFANRNHYASLLAAAVPLSTAWSIGLILQWKGKWGLGLSFLILAYALLLLGLGMAHSRAGLILAFVGALASVGLVWKLPVVKTDPSKRKKILVLLFGANLVGLGLAFQFGFVAFANRFENEDVLEDLRRPIAEVTSHAVTANLPLGAGFGAFEPIYQMFEPVAVTLPDYVNHAHDDWLEIALDGGVPAIVIMLGFLIWYARTAIRVWSALPTGEPIDRILAQSATIVTGLLLLHSIVDYPLRTTTLMVVFACAAALMVPPVATDEATNQAPHRSRATNKKYGHIRSGR